MANYLYNGVELPDINEVWTDEVKAEYPYAHIVYSISSGIYRIRFTSGIVSYSTSYNPYGSPCLVGHGKLLQYNAEGASWVFSAENETNAVGLTNSRLVWSSHDVLNEDDNSVYLAASDPIPVNPAPTLYPTSLLMGWQVVRRIRQSK